MLALRKIPISIEILKETKIGNSVYDAKKKFPVGSKCHNESRDIIALWKKSCDIQADATKQSTASVPSNSTNDVMPESQKKKTPLLEKAADVNESVDADDDGEVEKNYDSLSVTRRKVRVTDVLASLPNSHFALTKYWCLNVSQIMDLFTDHLNLSTVKINIAKFLSYNIEASINELHCSIADSKSYIAKARSLSYNLKRNEVNNR